MKFICLGLNHRTASVDVRERFAVSEGNLGAAAGHLRSLEGVEESVVISTCNRTEYYAVGGSPDEVLERLRGFLDEHAGESLGPEHIYIRTADDVARHLCRVVSGMDSMVLGETEVFGQAKRAYKAALEGGHTAGGLNRLFQKAFAVGKKVRTVTGIQIGQTSIGSVAVDLAEKIFGHLRDSRVMVLGAGEMSRITAQSLLSRGAQSIFVANRTYDNAVALADELGGKAVHFDRWLEVLQEVDVVISSTGAPRAIVHREHVEEIRRKRKFRPLFFIDIAVPRDIDTAVGEIEEVYLYDIDTLEQIANEGRERREAQMKECDLLIEGELKKMGVISE